MLPAPDNSHIQPGENNTEDNLRPLEIIVPLLDLFFGLTLPFQKVAEHALICLDKIGNKYRTRYGVWVEVVEGFAELPANCERIQAVLTGTGRLNNQLPLSSANTTQQLHVETNNWPELNLIANTTPDQLGVPIRWQANNPINPAEYGQRLIDYTFRDGGLYVGSQTSLAELTKQATGVVCATDYQQPQQDVAQYVYVLYQGRISDERGYPLVTPEEALACAYFSNYVTVYRRYTMKQASAQDIQLAQQLKDQHINQARVAPLGNSNALDKVLDESKRFHRHFFTDDFIVN